LQFISPSLFLLVITLRCQNEGKRNSTLCLTTLHLWPLLKNVGVVFCVVNLSSTSDTETRKETDPTGHLTYHVIPTSVSVIYCKKRK